MPFGTQGRSKRRNYALCILNCSVVSDSETLLTVATPPTPKGSSVLEFSQVRELEWVVISSPGDLSDPVIKPASPALAGGFFTSETSGKPLED